MKQHKNRLYFLTALAVMTNGFSLIGCAHGSVGAVAKNIEANHNIARGITNERALPGLSGNPPTDRESRLPAAFDMSSLKCYSSYLA
ncbi:hypothetical protein [Metapseudomonas resinovorans]|uniref:Lipoprotein n=1 Tax=Metapseudomonas resinovorans NBRC 106553 TaxID=1245471 RepID=S6BG07_METRE|nr:hypothetical protein [Pseudomonas resinovorans]BAN47994.1 hypothetical protein PCA10_22620 [Pseudomonas resinovorans NBRC 106553]